VRCTDGARSLYPTSVTASAAVRVGPNVFPFELWLSTEALGAPSCGVCARILACGLSLGGGSGLGEILRHGQSRCADASGEAPCEGYSSVGSDRADAEVRSATCGNVDGHDTRNAARRAVIAAIGECVVGRVGSRARTSRTSLRAVRG